MKIVELLESKIDFDIDYYLTEGCGIFAYILSQIKGEGMIEVLSDPEGEAWDDKITFEVTHVVLNVAGALYDVRGKRSLGQIINKDFPYGLKRSVIESPQEFKKNYMGDGDQFPLYGPQAEDYIKITEYVKNNSSRFDLKLKESATAGSTGAGSIATVAGGLGAGFDPDGEWRSIYSKREPKKSQSRSILIKRSM